jgi:hypothetical protein
MLHAPEDNHTDDRPASHQPDQGRFRAVRPDEVHWTTVPSYPPTVRMAILVGDPSKPVHGDFRGVPYRAGRRIR